MIPSEFAIPKSILQVCNDLAGITYENLTKIIRFQTGGTAMQAVKLDDSHQNNIDHWMGGGTCFSITWRLYLELQQLGFAPRLLMGHKRNERNVHCALALKIDHSELFFDPGYLIFDPIIMPAPNCENLVPLVPNQVRLVRTPDGSGVALYTASMADTSKNPYKLRFEFHYPGVDVTEFKEHWQRSFEFEMMQYPVLNRLDREKGIQYYFQKSNLVIRSAQGSTMEKIDPILDSAKLSDIFKIDEGILTQAMQILKK